MQTPLQARSSLDRLQSLLPEVFTPNSRTGELFLRFQLTNSIEAAISLERIVETLRLPAQSITPMPNMPTCTLGLMENQGKVFWAVDLAQALGLSQGATRTREYEIIIIEALPLDNSTTATANSTNGETLLLGLAVAKIRSTLRLQSDEIKAPIANTLSALEPYIQGSFQQNDDETLILSVEALSNAKGLYGD